METMGWQRYKEHDHIVLSSSFEIIHTTLVIVKNEE